MSDSPVGSQAPAGAAGWQRSQGSSKEGKADRTYPREAGDDRCGTLSRGPNPPRSSFTSLQTSLPKCKLKCKIKNFQMAITDD